MLLRVVLILLPALSYANININLDVGKTIQSASVKFEGSTVEVIPDKEKDAWKLRDSQLKVAAWLYSGALPNNAYLKSPTPWDDLYTRYGWKQVHRTLYPISAKIIGINSLPVIVTTQDFINNSSVTATFNAAISQQVQETVSSSWTKGEQLQLGQEISYKIKFGGSELGGSTSFSYTASWGVGVSKSQTVTVGSSNGVQVTLKPGQKAIATLTANRGTMEVQVKYRATLDGFAACNYSEGHDGHHFWAYDINACLRAVGSPTTIDSTETLKIGFYSDAKTVVTDKHTSIVLIEAASNIF